MTTSTAENLDMVIEVEETRVSCDGGGGALGHPRVYLTIKPAEGQIVCPYCSRTFVLKEGAGTSGGH
ncbi:MAG: zinc-finger domain-containing protein [Magnetovibrionaceae bacterium]